MDEQTEELLEGRYPNLAFMLRLMEGKSKETGKITLPSLNDLEEFDLIYVYGLGEYDSLLSQWLNGKANRDLVFLEDDIGALRAFLLQDSANEVLSHPRIEIRFNPEPDRQSDFLAECAAEYPIEKVEVLATDSRMGGQFDQMRLELLRLTTVQHALFIESTHYHQIFKNLVANFHQFPRSFFANQLKGQFQGVPAVICGAGPSLNREIEELRKLEDRALIIAGGSAVTALSRAKLRPHLEMAMDPNPEEYERFQNTSSGDIPLIYNTRLFPEVFEMRTGPLGYLQSGTGGSGERWMEEKLNIPVIPQEEGFDLEALSVTTAAIQYAVTLGCNPIILVGIDLAFTDQKAYAEGVTENEGTVSTSAISEQCLIRPDIYGKPVETQVKWIMESESIGKYAKAYPNTTFLNATSGGIGFPGIRNCRLDEISMEKREGLRDRLLDAIAKVSLNVKSEDVTGALDELKDSFDQAAQFIKEAQDELERIKNIPSNPETGKMILFQMELESLEAYKCCLREQCDALDFALSKKYRPIHYTISEEKKNKLKYLFLKEKWSSLRSLATYYLKLLEESFYAKFG